MTLRFSILPFLLIASVGCMPQSEWTTGDDGTTQWQLSDGLCPAFGCDLDVPVAPGADITLAVRGIDMTGLHATAGGSAVMFTPNTSTPPTSASIHFTPTTPGDVPLVLLDAVGVERGRTTFHVRTPTALDCGIITDDSPDWKLDGVPTSDVLTISLASVARNDGFVQVGCRATDSQGPIMTRYEIQWSIESTSSLQLHGDFASAPYQHSEGARIRVRAIAVGETVVHVVIGDVADTVRIDVIP